MTVASSTCFPHSTPTYLLVFLDPKEEFPLIYLLVMMSLALPCNSSILGSQREFFHWSE